MAYAPHHNGMVNKYNDLPVVLGCFENEYSIFYEFFQVVGFNPFPEYDNLIYVGPNGCETRYAKILKTVAYVVIDENPDGSPVVEKLYIKKHRNYDISGVDITKI